MDFTVAKEEKTLSPSFIHFASAPHVLFIMWIISVITFFVCKNKKYTEQNWIKWESFYHAMPMS